MATICAAALLAVGCETEGEPHSHAAAGAGGSKVSCDEVPEPFRPNLSATSADGTLTATIVDALPSPPEKLENSWTVQFSNAQGEPATNAQLTFVEPFMPAHNHNGKKIPIITKMDPPATYRVDVINLWMDGAWRITFTLDMDGTSKDVVFWTCVEPL